MCSGVFDRFPRCRLILGHLGEGLSFSLPRTDNRLRVQSEGSHGSHKRPLQY
jgi:2,3-dihydroxybenzoate decarboxylase